VRDALRPKLISGGRREDERGLLEPRHLPTEQAVSREGEDPCPPQAPGGVEAEHVRLGRLIAQEQAARRVRPERPRNRQQLVARRR